MDVNLIKDMFERLNKEQELRKVKLDDLVKWKTETLPDMINNISDKSVAYHFKLIGMLIDVINDINIENVEIKKILETIVKK